MPILTVHQFGPFVFVGQPINFELPATFGIFIFGCSIAARLSMLGEFPLEVIFSFGLFVFEWRCCWLGVNSHFWNGKKCSKSEMHQNISDGERRITSIYKKVWKASEGEKYILTKIGIEKHNFSVSEGKEALTGIPRLTVFNVKFSSVWVWYLFWAVH